MERKPFLFKQYELGMETLFTFEDERMDKKSHPINGEAAYRDAAGNTHPVIRQFILRGGIVNYLGKVLQQRWTDWHNQTMQEDAVNLGEEEEYQKNRTAAKENLHKVVLELHTKLAEAHRHLKREMNDLFTYVMDKHELWNCKEYFKVKTVLELANKNLIKFAPPKLGD
ncbi:uncharacterized protein [Drosophila pseudoobscura]|uniref:Uncharacterized protein n=1 Tax=Drosophila pseudoobscura pseudoobscura TaxID=46245 RepID=A0A6I8USB1_DROPS|nr:uncharacterized protein LOC4803234 [Drosophila pseudoobscura]